MNRVVGFEHENYWGLNKEEIYNRSKYSRLTEKSLSTFVLVGGGVRKRLTTTSRAALTLHPLASLSYLAQYLGVRWKNLSRHNQDVLPQGFQLFLRFQEVLGQY